MRRVIVIVLSGAALAGCSYGIGVRPANTSPLLAAWNASRTRDKERLQKSLEQFRASYTPLEISAVRVKPME
jgi:hypothetical protein